MVTFGPWVWGRYPPCCWFINANPHAAYSDQFTRVTGAYNRNTYKRLARKLVWLCERLAALVAPSSTAYFPISAFVLEYNHYIFLLATVRFEAVRDSNALATSLSALSTYFLDSNEFPLEGFSCCLKNLNNAMLQCQVLREENRITQ